MSTLPQSASTRPLRIGIDCRMFSSAFTGIGRYTFELVSRFIIFNDAQDHPHQLVLFFNEPEFSRFTTTSPNVEKILVNAPHYSLKEQTTFAHKLYKANLNLVHFPHFNVPILYRRPYVLTIHDLILSLFPGKKMNKWYHRLAYNLTIKNATHKAKKIIAVSESTKKDIVELLKISADKIQVIYNGISPIFRHLTAPNDLNKIDGTLKKYNIRKPFLLYTGVWRNHKNLVNLIDAFRELCSSENASSTGSSLSQNGILSASIPISKSETAATHPASARPASARPASAVAPAGPLLVLTGRPDPHYPEIPAAIKRHQLEDKIIMPGLVSEEELVHLYNAAKIYVFPSLYEGFGLPPLEAMACGTPVAASNSSCIPEVCGQGNALFFNPQDPHDIAKKIQEIYATTLSSNLSAKGLAHAQKFSWDTAAKETFNLLLANLPNQ